MGENVTAAAVTLLGQAITELGNVTEMVGNNATEAPEQSGLVTFIDSWYSKLIAGLCTFMAIGECILGVEFVVINH